MNRIPGLMLPLETLYPTAMLPTWSMAALPIHRKLASGANVPCWKIVGVAPGVLISYHRIPTLVPDTMEWFTTRASWSPKLR